MKATSSIPAAFRQIPENWQTVKLGSLVKIVTDGIAASDLAILPKVHHFSLPAFDIGKGPDICSGSSIKSNKTIVPRDCVLFSKLNPRIPRIWRIGAEAPEHSYCSTEFWALVKKSRGVDLDYLKHYLSHDAFLSHPSITPASSTNSHQRVDRRSFEGFNLSIPPIEEQRQIAEVLRSVDEALASGVETARHLWSLRKLALAEFFLASEDQDAVATILGRLLPSWQVVAADEVCEAVIDCKNRTPPITNEGLAVVRTMNVRNGRFVRANLARTDAQSFAEWTKRGEPQVGDVLITREAPIGEVCAVPQDEPVCLGQRMMLYRPRQSDLHSGYLLYALQSAGVQDHLVRLAGGSTVGHVRVGDIRHLPLPVPDMETQVAIAEAMTDIDRALDQSEQVVAGLQAMKAAMSADLLTGHVRVPA
jgi:type I restriction enzyme, S subunit